MIPDAEKRFRNMELLARYFETHAEHEPLFIPERDSALAVNQKIRHTEVWSAGFVAELALLINQVDEYEHYDSVAWTDYKMHLNGITRQLGFEPDGWHNKYNNS